MGFDPVRFSGEVDDELKCPICCFVLEDGVQAPDCEHTFCQECIHEWLSRQTNCPVDRQPLTRADLKPAPRVLRNFLAKLDIKCDFASSGCPAVVKLELLTSHCNECDFNPYKPVICEKGCGLVLLRNQVDEHNCLSDLRELVTNQQKQINELKSSKKTQEEQICEMKANLKRLQDLDINEHQRQIHNLQQAVNRMQQHMEVVQKQHQFLAQQQSQQRSQSPIEMDDECESCLFATGSRKRPLSWKDFPGAKRGGCGASASGGGKPCHVMSTDGHSSERSAPSPYSESDVLRHNYYHNHNQGLHHNHQHPVPFPGPGQGSGQGPDQDQHPHPSPHSSPHSSSSCPSANQLHQQLITFYGSVLTVNVAEEESVESVKAKIESKEGIPGEQQLLFFAGQQLEDERSLAYYHINSDTSRHLVLRLRDGMKIFVKTLADKTIEVMVDPSETIEIVKVKIHEQEGISPCDQRLLCGGRDMADLRTLSDYGIKHKSTLQLDLHLGGPCPICQTQFKNSVPETGGPKSVGSASPSPSSSSSSSPVGAGKGEGGGGGKGGGKGGGAGGSSSGHPSNVQHHGGKHD